MAVDLGQIIPPLVRAKVDFILIGGMAAILHGSARVTFDVDLVYSRAHKNIERLAAALAVHGPNLRDAPLNLPFSWDAKTIRSGLNLLSQHVSVTSISSAQWPVVRLTRICWRIHSMSMLWESDSNVSIFRRSFASKKWWAERESMKRSRNCEFSWKRRRRSESRRALASLMKRVFSPAYWSIFPRAFPMH